MPAPLLTPARETMGTEVNSATTLWGTFMVSDPLGEDPERSPLQLLNR